MPESNQMFGKSAGDTPDFLNLCLFSILNSFAILILLKKILLATKFFLSFFFYLFLLFLCLLISSPSYYVWGTLVSVQIFDFRFLADFHVLESGVSKKHAADFFVTLELSSFCLRKTPNTFFQSEATVANFLNLMVFNLQSVY